MTHQETIDLEIRRLALKYKGNCRALLQLPMMVYRQILEDNKMRKKPYRVGFNRIQRVIQSMPEVDF